MENAGFQASTWARSWSVYWVGRTIAVVMRTALPEKIKMFSKLPNARDVTLPRDD